MGRLAVELDVIVKEVLQTGDYAKAFGQLAHLRGPLDAFFTEVMVMHEDQALRTNRLALSNT